MRLGPASLLVLALGAWWLVGCGRTERWQGRTWEEWAGVLDGASSAQDRRTAVDALGVLAQEAPAEVAPRLLAAAGAPDEELRRRAMAALAACGEPGRAGLEQGLADASPRVAEAALAALGSWEGRALPSAPRMVALLSHAAPAVAQQAALALVRLGPEVLAHLSAPLRDPDPRRRALALSVPGRQGPADPAARALLLAALADEEWSIRQRAAASLAAAAREDARVREALVAALDDPHPEVVAAAGAALAEAGASALPALARLVALLASEHGPVRRGAALALGGIGAAAREALPEVERALAAEHGAATVALWMARRRIGGEVEPTVRALAGLVASPPEAQALEAIRALGILGAEAAAAVPPLCAALSDRGLRLAAVEALARMGPAAHAAAPALQALRNDPNAWLRERVAEALARLGAPGEGP